MKSTDFVWITGLVITLSGATPSLSQAPVAGAPAAPAVAAPKPSAADGPRNEAANLRKQADETSQRLAKAAPKVKEAADALVAAKRAEAGALDNVVAAIGAGKPADIKAAWEQRDKARAPTGLAQEKLSAREGEQRNILDDAQIERMTKSTPAAAKPKLVALIAARKAAAAAWAAVADMVAPGTDLAPAKEKALVAEGAVRVAARDHDISCEIARAEEDATRTGADLSQPLKEMRALLDQAVDIEKKRVELDLAVQNAEAKRREIRESFRAGLDKARKSHDDTKKVERWISDHW